MDGKARPAPWESNRDLPIVPDAWLLPLPAVERAGSSKITKTGNSWCLMSDKRAHGACYKASLEVARSQGVEQAMQCDQCQLYVLWAALHPHMSLSPCQSDALEWHLVYLPLQPNLEVELKSQAMDARWKQTGKCCGVLSTSKCLPKASFCDIEDFWLNKVIKWKL